jgi:DNA-binding GntR family transcriptional regulator
MDQPRFPPLSLPETIYRQLRSAILNGDLRPGQMLRQEELARSLGASRAPLREALPRLEAEGLVVLQPRRGYAVISLEPDDISELFELRILIEEHQARLATQRRTVEDIAKLTELVENMAALGKSPNTAAMNAWFEQNVVFHDMLLAPGGQKHFQRVVASLRSAIELYIRVELRLTGDFAQAQAEHEQILNAFIKGNADQVARLTREHSIHTRQRLLEGLRKAKPRR